MSLISLLLVLLIEQLQPSSLRQPVLRRYLQLADRVADRLPLAQRRQGWLAWALAVLLPAGLSALLYYLLDAVGWLLSLPWLVAVLHVCLAYRPFGQPLARIRDALDMGQEQQARQWLADWKQVDVMALPHHDVLRQALEQGTRDAHRQLFGVLAAFLIGMLLGLGPAGAVLFRAADVLAQHWRQPRAGEDAAADALLTDVSRQAWNWINWLPARVTAASFAVAGNFEQALDNWRFQMQGLPASVSDTDTDADTLVQATAMGAIDLSWPLPAAVGTPRLPAPQDLPAADAPGASMLVEQPGLRSLQALSGLIRRALWLWCLLLALITLTRWVS